MAGAIGALGKGGQGDVDWGALANRGEKGDRGATKTAMGIYICVYVWYVYMHMYTYMHMYMYIHICIGSCLCICVGCCMGRFQTGWIWVRQQSVQLYNCGCVLPSHSRCRLSNTLHKLLIPLDVRSRHLQQLSLSCCHHCWQLPQDGGFFFPCLLF